MPEAIPNKLYYFEVNGVPYLQELPATNTPAGAREATKADILRVALKKMDIERSNISLGKSRQDPGLEKRGTDAYNALGGDSVYGQLANANPDNLTPEQLNLIGQVTGTKNLSTYYGGGTTESDLVYAIDPLTGQTQPMKKTDVEEMQKHDDAVKAGTERKVELPQGGYGYVPVGSAADKNYLQTGSLIVPEAQQQEAATTTSQPNTSTNASGSNSSGSVPSFNRSLSPGDTGDDVKALQSYLVSQGYMTQAEMDTGPGTYGPKTKAAVTAWQKAVGVVPKDDSEYGYFGPLSQAALKQQSTSGGQTSTSGKVGVADGPVVPGSETANILPNAKPSELAASPVTGTPASGGGDGGNVFSTPVTGKAFQDTDAYKALSAEDKAFIDQAFNLISVGTEKDAEIFAQAVQKAMDLADPYFKSKIALAKAGVGVQLARLSNNYDAAKDLIEKTQKQLLEDVAANKGFLSIEQQAELAREAKDYGYDLSSIANEAADKGITFATGERSRVQAEQKRTDQYSDVVQSSNRDYNYKVAELEKAAARGDEAAATELANLTKDKELSLKDIGHSAEQILGSGNLTGIPGIDGYQPVGGVTGQIEEEKQRTLISDVKGAVDLSKDLISFN